MERTIALRLAQSALRSLTPRDRRTFDFRASTCRFEVAESGVQQLLLCRGKHVRSVYERTALAGRAAIVPTGESWRRDAAGTNRAHWVRFRGPGGRGISVDQNIPDEWDVAPRGGLEDGTARTCTLQSGCLGDDCRATPAIAGGLFLARTRHALMAIGRVRVASAP